MKKKWKLAIIGAVLGALFSILFYSGSLAQGVPADEVCIFDECPKACPCNSQNQIISSVPFQFTTMTLVFSAVGFILFFGISFLFKIKLVSEKTV